MVKSTTSVRGPKGRGKPAPFQPQHEFSALLWRAVRATNPGAEMISPLGFGILTTLVKVGARGPAGEEIVRALHYKDVAATVQRYSKLLKSTEGWKMQGVRLSIFTAICGPPGVAFHDDFVDFAEDTFRAHVKTVNYGKQLVVSKELNDSIANFTKNRMTSVLKPADIGPKTNLMLLSAVCFRGLFKNSCRFKANQTKKEEFFNLNGTISEVDMMAGTADYIYGRLDSYDSSALSITYEGGKYSLTLVLPDSKTGLPKLEKYMDENFFYNVRSKIKWSNRVFTAKIPKFKVNCRVDLVAVLKSMGVKTMFDQKADFRGYFRQNGHGHYSRVFQQCALEVNEKGSEGGAQPTGVKLQTGDVKFEANHPFLFFVTEEKSNAVVLLGCKHQF